MTSFDGATVAGGDGRSSGGDAGDASSPDDPDGGPAVSEPAVQATGSDGADAEGAVELSPDDAFEVLRNPRRRHALRLLSDGGDPIPLTDLASTIASIENDKTVEEVTTAERKRVYISLYQCHVPRMDKVGIVEWDGSNGDVTLTQDGAELAELLAEYAGRKRDVSRFYPAISAVALAAAFGAYAASLGGLSALFLGAGLALAATTVIDATG